MAEGKLIHFEDFFRLTSSTFKTLGLNPYFDSKHSSSRLQKFLNQGWFHFCFWLLALTVYLEAAYLVSVFGDMSLYMHFCKTISCFPFDLMGLEQMILIWSSASKIDAFILQLEEMFPRDLGTQQLYRVQRQAKDTILTLRTILSSFLLCLFTWLVITPTYDVLVCYFTATPYVLELPFMIWSPSGLEETTPFYIALFLESVTMYASVMIIASVIMLYVSIVSQIGLQFEILAQNIRNLRADDLEGLGKITQQHMRLIDISQQFAGLISRTVFFNHLLSTLGICISLFQINLTDETFRYVVYLLTVFTQTFSLSSVGDSIMQQVRKGVELK